jgi:hypothetical protein
MITFVRYVESGYVRAVNPAELQVLLKWGMVEELFNFDPSVSAF